MSGKGARGREGVPVWPVDYKQMWTIQLWVGKGARGEREYQYGQSIISRCGPFNCEWEGGEDREGVPVRPVDHKQMWTIQLWVGRGARGEREYQYGQSIISRCRPFNCEWEGGERREGVPVRPVDYKQMVDHSTEWGGGNYKCRAVDCKQL